MKQRVIEWRHALSSFRWHLQQCLHMSTTLPKGFHHSFLTMDTRTIDNQCEWGIVQCPCLLSQRAIDVVDEHFCVDALRSCSCSLFWCIDDRCECLVSIDACDHIESFGVGGGLFH